MELQNTIIKQYLLLNHDPTLRQIAKDTGIQQTRVFRLFNGSEMKLSEYEIFKRLVKEKIGSTTNLETMAGECVSILSSESVREIENLMSRKLATWKLKQELNKSENKQSIA